MKQPVQNLNPNIFYDNNHHIKRVSCHELIVGQTVLFSSCKVTSLREFNPAVLWLRLNADHLDFFIPIVGK